MQPQKLPETMTARHIHIKGLVQGVGFRPHVFALATKLGIKGYVHNSSDGVHIVAEGSNDVVESLYQSLIQQPPLHAIISSHHMHEITMQHFDRFVIAASENHQAPDLLITPDLGMCDDCRQELFDTRNRRYRYPFITCIHCGPRYSITTALPYDRCHTSMQSFEQCIPCRQEYYHPLNRRYYSQTNSCADCGISLTLYEVGKGMIAEEENTLLETVNRCLLEGNIVAVKGIGGFLLMCDAQNTQTIASLRLRKNRPAKPLALLYPNLETLEQHAILDEAERSMIQDSKSPVVLCRTRQKTASQLPIRQIAPGLNRIGVMLPYAPLLALIAENFGRPLVATSANISGSPIIFENEEAIQALDGIADYVLLHNRDIVVPQDDSVVQYSAKHRQMIMLRRSRGWAPGIYPCPLLKSDEKVLAMGGELKSSFAIQQNERCYVSQFLGDLSYFESQQSYKHTLQHISNLLRFEPDKILIDKHPSYESSAYGKELSNIKRVPIQRIQHHEAHAAAVLAENNLLDSSKPILCLAWDGTGYGHDGNIWGSESFVYHDGAFERLAHLDYFPILMGDKMSKEPRLSALVLLHHHEEATALLQHKFSTSAWGLYKNALKQLNMPQTSSMGRLLDGIASILGLIDISQYEGQAAMLLQAKAESCTDENALPYEMPIEGNIIKWQPMLDAIVTDINAGKSRAVIAKSVHLTLAALAVALANENQIDSIAVSGGVWQNSLLVDMLIDKASSSNQLHFHQQLPPNDECISFGQLAWYTARQQNTNHALQSASHSLALN